MFRVNIVIPKNAQHMKKALMRIADDTGRSGPSLPAYRINEYCSICWWIENVQIRLHGCACSTRPSLLAYSVRIFFPSCTSNMILRYICKLLSKALIHLPYGYNPKYWDTLTPYHTCPKIWNSLFYFLLVCVRKCWMGGKQSRPWSDGVFCGTWSGSTLFAHACLSQYFGL